MKKSKAKEVDRRVLGISVEVSPFTGPRCHLIYEVSFSDGGRTTVRGDTVFGSARDGEVDDKFRLDLHALMTAAGYLVRELEDACAKLDKVKL